MANSQQKNHPNERMNTTAVLRDGVAAARRATSAAKSDTRVPSDARVTATPASAARGSEGASAGRELRGEVAGAAATAARRGAARRGLSFGGEGARTRRQRVARRAVRERVTRGALGMGVSCRARATKRKGRRRATKKTGARTRERWHEAGAPPGGRRTRSSRRPWRGASVVVSELVERKAQNDLVSRCKKIRRRHITNGHKFKLQNVHMRN